MSLQLHEFTIPFKGVAKKVIYHFSDCHMSVAGPTPEEEATAKKLTADYDGCRDWFADHCKEPFDNSVTALEYFEEIINACGDGDAVLCAGDLVEFPNHATLAYVDEKTAHLNFVSVCGNHDLPEKFPDGYAISATKQPVQTLDLGDLLVVAFDDSQRRITPEQLTEFKALLAGNKPLILLMHIPFGVEGNMDMLRGCGEYFRLNYDDCPAENEEFIRLIRENDSRIAAVLMGHLHFNHTCPITDTLTMYVSSQGMCGHMNKYVIGE